MRKSALTVENVYKKTRASVRRDSTVIGVHIVSYSLSIYVYFLKQISFLAKCVVPCLNGGKCIGANICRCNFGFQGDHCEIGQPIKQHYNCKRPCRHGYCTENKTCRCQQGWFGKFCQRSKYYFF